MSCCTQIETNRVREKDRKTLREKETKRERVSVRVKVKGQG